MKELKVGERVTLEVQEVEDISCQSCFFWNKLTGCTNSIVKYFADRRSDKKKECNL